MPENRLRIPLQLIKIFLPSLLEKLEVQLAT
jgi:hypothetical protein